MLIGFIYHFGDYFTELIFNHIDKFYFYSNREYNAKYIKIIFYQNRKNKFLLEDEENILIKRENIHLTEESQK